MDRNEQIRDTLNQHIRIFQKLESQCLNAVIKVGDRLIEALKQGRKVLIAGNGGSAADAQHFAAELIGRFVRERSAIPAMALTTDTSILTAVTNDYGYDEVFRRQVVGLGCEGDVFVGISTSGNSQNVICATKAASEMGLHTVALLGKDGGKLAELADQSIIVPATNTARIQEAHQWIYHTWCEMIDNAGIRA